MNTLPMLFAQQDTADAGTESTKGAFEFSLENLAQMLQEQGQQLALNLVAGLAIFIIGRWAAKLMVRILAGLLDRSHVDETLKKFLCSISSILLMTLVVIAALNRIGVDTTSLAAVIAATGLAIGLALQNSLGNFASGVMLLLFRPFKVGDFVEAGGTSGVIEEIQIFSTVLRTGDNVRIILPNGAITGGNITNFSANPTRRIDLVVSCGYGDDLQAVKSYLQQLLQSDERILADPESVVAVNELADSGINLVVRPWVKSGDYWPTRWDLTEKIKLDFDEKGFSIPYPTQDVHIHNAA